MTPMPHHLGRRSLLTGAVASAAALLLAACGSGAGSGSHSGSGADAAAQVGGQQGATSPYQGLNPGRTFAKPDVTLTDTSGKPFDLARQTAGKTVLLYFGYTHCPDVCPTTLFDVSEIFTRLGPDADRVGALFVTVDPERDTPATLKDYMASFDPHVRGLTGDPAAVTATEKAYRVYSKKVPLDEGDYAMDHTAIVYLMDKDGRFVAPFNLKRKPEEAAADLRRYL
jgi:protein SCO1/2